MAPDSHRDGRYCEGFYNNMSDIKITIIDREGEAHVVSAPTDMNMNLMEVVRAYELAPEGTMGICGGMAMCASCQ